MSEMITLGILEEVCRQIDKVDDSPVPVRCFGFCASGNGTATVRLETYDASGESTGEYALELKLIKEES